MSGLAKRLVWCMKNQGLTARGLAEKIGTSHTSISWIINNDKKSSDWTESIAKALGVSFAWLATGIDADKYPMSTLLPILHTPADLQSFKQDRNYQPEQKIYFSNFDEHEDFVIKISNTMYICTFRTIPKATRYMFANYKNNTFEIVDKKQLPEKNQPNKETYHPILANYQSEIL